MKNKSKKALVTGGAGFIGSHLADALVSAGWQVSVIDNLSTGKLSNLEQVRDKISFYKGDILDEVVLQKAVKNCDVIFHQAAIVSVPLSIEKPVHSARVNEMGTLAVLESARKNNVRRVVSASSSAVYGDDPQLPKSENMALKPLSPYAVQKLAGEYYSALYHKLYGLETVCMRYFNVYGPRQDPTSPYSGVISIFMSKAVSQKTPVIYGDGNQYRDFIFIQDVVKANLLASSTDGASGKVFNAGTGQYVTINGLWEMACELSGVNIKPEHEAPKPGDIVESVANIDQARKILGFNPEYSFKNGLEITFNWYQKNR
ncbi:MAG: SDR family oxidoreductase [Thermodesulfobacteriota bacterium]|nr:SDR family oxidoreductase [Thermodesulfobacteriota bacterium]